MIYQILSAESTTELYSIPGEHHPAKLNSIKAQTWHNIIQKGDPQKYQYFQNYWNKKSLKSSIFINTPCLA